jgi:hypothetical protein
MQRLLLVLLLLSLDWYFDPSFGNSPSSRPFSSTEMVCKSLALKNNLQQKIELTAPQDLQPFAGLLQPSNPAGPHEAAPFEQFITNHFYALMSMQC